MRSNLDVCPSCGDFARLDEYSGWCSECSDTSSPVRECEGCGRTFPNDLHRTCSTCRKEAWLLKNADLIEVYLEKGYEPREAIKQAREANKTRCICCHKPLGRSGLFCKRPACRRVYERYKRRLTEGLQQERAIREALKAA